MAGKSHTGKAIVSVVVAALLPFIPGAEPAVARPSLEDTGLTAAARARPGTTPDRATAARRRKRARTVKRPYRLSVVFSQDYSTTTETRQQGSGLRSRVTSRTTFSGPSVPVWLVRSGRRSTPLYQLRSRSTGAAKVAVPGHVTFSGSGRYEVWDPTSTCVVDPVTYTLPGTGAASVEILLARNHLDRLKIQSNSIILTQGTMVCQTATLGEVSSSADNVWGYGPVSSPPSDHSAELATQLGGIARKSVKFGRSFDLEIRHDPDNDPALKFEEKTPTNSISETWSYSWRLEFRPG